MAKRNSTPALKAIHAHWHGKVSGGQSLFWQHKLGWYAVENILEGGAATAMYCYACGKEASLQRCHIIPHQFGGSMEPSNLFLMCVDCHADNPDGLDRDVFFTFVKHRESWAVRTYKVLQASFLSLLETHPKGPAVKKYMAGDHGHIWDVLDIKQLTLGVGVNNKITPATTAGAGFMKLVELAEKEGYCV